MKTLFTIIFLISLTFILGYNLRPIKLNYDSYLEMEMKTVLTGEKKHKTENSNENSTCEEGKIHCVPEPKHLSEKSEK